MVHPLLSRALISAAASAVTTTVWVKTAENSQKRRQQLDAEADQKDELKKDSEIEQDGLRHTLRRAQLDVQPASVALRTEVFLGNILNAPKNAVLRLRGFAEENTEESAQTQSDEVSSKKSAKTQKKEAERTQKQPSTTQRRRKKRTPAEIRKRAQKRADKEKRLQKEETQEETAARHKEMAKKRRKRERERARTNAKNKRKRKNDEQEWGIGASIKAEVKKQVKEAAVESIKETFEAAGDKLTDTKDVLVEKGQELSSTLKASIPDDVGGTLSNAADTFKEGAGKFSERVSETLATPLKEVLPESADEMGKEVAKGLKGLGRYLQGPGSQDYDEKKEAEDPKTAFVSAQTEDDGKFKLRVIHSEDFSELEGPDLADDFSTEDESDLKNTPIVEKNESKRILEQKEGRSIVQRRLQAIREKEKEKEKEPLFAQEKSSDTDEELS